MPELPIAGRALQRVSHRVSVVQDGSLPGLIGITGNDVRLDPDRPTNRLVDAVAIALQEPCDVRHQPIDERTIGDHAGFHDFGQRRPIFLVWQAGEILEIGEDRYGLPHGAHQVLSRGQVDGGFATDAALDHGQDRGGHLDVANSSHPGGGRKAGHVSHGPAAERNDATLPIDADFGELGVDRSKRVQLLRRLPRWDRHRRRRDGKRFEGILERAQVLPHDHQVAHDDDGLARSHSLHRLRNEAGQVSTNRDFVRSTRHLDGHSMNAAARKARLDVVGDISRLSTIGANHQVGSAIAAQAMR